MKMLILETNNNENIRIRQAVKNGYTELTVYPSVADLSYPTSKTRRGRVQSMNERERESRRGGISVQQLLLRVVCMFLRKLNEFFDGRQ